MALGAVDADGDLGAGGAQLLKEPPVRADPQVLLCDFHLERAAALSGGRPRAPPPRPARPAGPVTHGAEVAGARRGVEAQQQPGDGDHVVLHEGLAGEGGRCEAGAPRGQAGSLPVPAGRPQSPAGKPGSASGARDPEAARSRAQGSVFLGGRGRGRQEGTQGGMLQTRLRGLEVGRGLGLPAAPTPAPPPLTW